MKGAVQCENQIKKYERRRKVQRELDCEKGVRRSVRKCHGSVFKSIESYDGTQL
jgi:hypothetical protein